ncbi:hypothetical protein WJX73_002126 [Symbiochloris irregularis]|uniref:Uncharacterized protein ycf33 n=1 Tax=Symbiochloris irregularis TaxID=706552 RepID=A0AAW1PY02_9CHLO
MATRRGVQVFSLADNEDFWQNLTQYARFFVSVLAGTAYVALKPLAGLLKKPSTAIVLVISLSWHQPVSVHCLRNLTATDGKSDGAGKIYWLDGQCLPVHICSRESICSRWPLVRSGSASA